MKLPKLSIAEENKSAFEKRLLTWTMIRDMFDGWYGAALYFKLDQQCRGNKRIRKKRAKRKVIQLMWADLRSSTGLEMTYEPK